MSTNNIKNLINNPTSSYFYYVKSKNVKAFPATYRGQYTVTQKVNDGITNRYVYKNYVFDPESRLNTEYNYSKIPGIDPLRESYVVSFIPESTAEGTEAVGKLSVVIGGYYFELDHFYLDDLKYGDGENAETMPLHIKLNTIELKEDADSTTGAGAIDSNRYTKVLGSWDATTKTLDKEITEGTDEGTYFFTGILIAPASQVNGATHKLDVIELDSIGKPRIRFESRLPEVYSGTGEAAVALGIKTDINNRAASGKLSFSHGLGNEASGEASHAEGYGTKASGMYSHAEGYDTTVSGQSSHAEGKLTEATGSNSHAEGFKSIAKGGGAHAEGEQTEAAGNYAHSEGGHTKVEKAGEDGKYSHSEGYYTTVSNIAAHAEGYYTTASGKYSHSEGKGTSSRNTIASGQSSHAEGYQTKAAGRASHSEGKLTVANGANSHTEGKDTKTYGKASHAEGGHTTTGSATEASKGKYAHAEGYYTKALGKGSHAEGYYTEANNDYAHTEGFYTITNGNYQTVVGKYNEAVSTNGAFIVGKGDSENRKNSLVAADSIITVDNTLKVVNDTDELLNLNNSDPTNNTATIKAKTTTINSNNLKVNLKDTTTSLVNIEASELRTYSNIGKIRLDTSGDHKIRISGTDKITVDPTLIKLMSDSIRFDIKGSTNCFRIYADTSKRLFEVSSNVVDVDTATTIQSTLDVTGKTTLKNDVEIQGTPFFKSNGSGKDFNYIASDGTSLKFLEIRESDVPSWGNAVILGNAGTTAVVAGEGFDKAKLPSNFGPTNYNSENLYLLSDGATYLVTALDNNTNKKEWVFNTDGNISCPAYNGTPTWASTQFNTNKVGTINGTISTACDDYKHKQLIYCGMAGSDYFALTVGTDYSSPNDSSTNQGYVEFAVGDDGLYTDTNKREEIRFVQVHRSGDSATIQNTFKALDREGYTVATGLKVVAPDGNRVQIFKDGSTAAGVFNINHKMCIHANGSIYTHDNITSVKTIQATNFNATSDARLKENIKPFNYSKSILSLPIYTFDFKGLEIKNQIGCLAQELQEIYPELVDTDSNGYLSIKEGKLIYLLLEEIKRMDKRISELEGR